MEVIHKRHARARVEAWQRSLPGEIPTLGCGDRFVPNRVAPEFEAPRTAFWQRTVMPAAALSLKHLRARAHEVFGGNLRKRYGPSGLIFVHVPKNAGSSVSDALYNGPSRHSSARFLQAAMSLPVFDAFVSFAILREPRARFASAFNYLKYTSTVAEDLAFRHGPLAGVSDVAACARRFADPAFREEVTRWPHFRDQCQYVCGADGSVLVDQLFSMRRLDMVEAMIQAVCGAEQAVRHTNASPRTAPRRIDWSAVDEYYCHDAALFAHVEASPFGSIRSARRRSALRRLGLS